MSNAIREAIKNEVIKTVANGKDVYKIGQVKWLVGNQTVHVRFCKPKSNGIFAYTVNKTTLSADYELWICSEAQTYYLIPVELISDMYHHPDGYVDSWHPKMRVMSVDTSRHLTLYAKGGRKKQFRNFYRATL